MADQDLELDVLRELLGHTGALTSLAGNPDTFQAVFAAFRSENPSAFQAALKRAELLPLCHRVCYWIRIKECVLLCLDLCGPPKPIDGVLDPHLLLDGIVRMTSDENVVQALADAVRKRDSAGFHAILQKFKLEPFCHLVCYWVCSVRYRLICEWICGGGRTKLPELWTELRDAGHALGALLNKPEAFKAAMAASNANDPDKLGAVVRDAGLFVYCHWICEWFCSWRCALVCLTLIRPYPLVAIEPAAQAREALDFARAIVPIATNPATLLKLSAAVGAADVQGFGAIVKEFKLERFVIQLCHWVCVVRCAFFCRLVCPPIYYHPWFTHVGDFSIVSDIDPGTGLTNKLQAGHGGPNFGFFGHLSLYGFCPKRDPAHPAEQMAYRFLFQPAGAATPTPITGGFVSDVMVGSRYALWNGVLMPQTVRIHGIGTTSPTPPTPVPGMLTPPDHYIVPDPKGWVTVDADAFDDAFSGFLMGFASENGIPVGPPNPPNPGVAAGLAVPPGNQKNGTDCAIIFQATRVGTIAAVNGGTPPDYTNSLAKARINNWAAVQLLDILQFHVAGGTPCSPLTTDLDIEYTVDHELIAAWDVKMLTAAMGVALTNAPPAVPIGPASTGANTARGGFGVHHENIGMWPTCSYTITLSTRRRLTTGLYDDSPNPLPKTFCIGLRKPKP
jgi:hypothetical protein